MKSFATAVVLGLVLSVLGAGCSSSSTKGQQANAPSTGPSAKTKGKGQAKRPRSQVYAVLLANIRSEEKSPPAIKKAVEALPWVKYAHVRIEENELQLGVKEDAKLNEEELKKAIEATGEAKVVRVVRESTA
jgi:hypothetical protein